MMTEQIVAGAALVVVGAVVTWLRFSPQAKLQQQTGRELAQRRAQSQPPTEESPTDSSAPEAADKKGQSGAMVMDRGAKLWNKRTAVLGPIGIALGLVLVLWGIFGP
jgi:hypothetical protein